MFRLRVTAAESDSELSINDTLTLEIVLSNCDSIVYDELMKVILSRLADHRGHLVTGVIIGLLVGLVATLLSPEVIGGGVIVLSLFAALAGSVASRSLSAYARAVRGDDDGGL